MSGLVLPVAATVMSAIILYYILPINGTPPLAFAKE